MKSTEHFLIKFYTGGYLTQSLAGFSAIPQFAGGDGKYDDLAEVSQHVVGLKQSWNHSTWLRVYYSYGGRDTMCQVIVPPHSPFLALHYISEK